MGNSPSSDTELRRVYRIALARHREYYAELVEVSAPIFTNYPLTERNSIIRERIGAEAWNFFRTHRPEDRAAVAWCDRQLEQGWLIDAEEIPGLLEGFPEADANIAYMIGKFRITAAQVDRDIANRNRLRN